MNERITCLPFGWINYNPDVPDPRLDRAAIRTEYPDDGQHMNRFDIWDNEIRTN